jgi:hypothetical protein
MATVFYKSSAQRPPKPPGKSKERLALEEELIERKIKSVDAEIMRSHLILAKARQEVIQKDVVEKQAAYLLVALRQRILSISSTYSRRILGLTDVKQSVALLHEIAISLLNDIRDLPQKVTDPHWFRELEQEDKP